MMIVGCISVMAEEVNPKDDRWGGCKGTIDTEGLLTISPKNGSEGTLGSWSEYSPWYDGYHDKIKSVRFEGTINLTTAIVMFAGCTNLQSIDFNGLNTANVENMKWMFEGCTKLTSLDLRGLNTSNVTNMDQMFSGCNSLTCLDLTNFNMSSVTNMDNMFWQCNSLNTIISTSTTPSTLKDGVFNTLKGTCKLLVPSGSIESYRQAAGWKDLTIIESYRLELTDNAPTLRAGTFYAGNVTYTRTVSGGVATFCLPFDISAAQVTDENQCIDKLYTVYSAAFLNAETNKLRLLIQQEAGTISAGKPFVVKCTAGSATFKNTNVVTYDGNISEPTPTQLQVFEDDGSSVLASNPNFNVSIGGTYQKWDNPGQGILAFITSGGFGQVSGYLNPFRMYVSKQAASAPAQIRNISVELLFGDDDPAAIELIGRAAESRLSATYNIMGQKVHPGTKGIVIKDGKKYLNR